jgi:diguanylate cyclase (GGDEF)-like protein
MRFRLIDRRDIPLAVGLVVSAVAFFHQPFGSVWDIVQQAEARYHLHLLPALTVLLAAFAFHLYRKREDRRLHALAAAAQETQARRHAEELERLVTLGQALSRAPDPSSLLQALWQYVPAFAHDREFWAMIKKDHGWLPLVQGATTLNSRPVAVLQAIAERTLSSQGALDGTADGIPDEDDVCFPMVAAGAIVGVLGIRATPPLSREDRRGLGAASAVIAIGVRNVQLLRATRELSLRDSLTGCFNRGYALEALANELRRAKRAKQPLSIVMFDIDQFKTINDQLGHLRGDEVLRMVGALLIRGLRASDIRCRYGGDEFLVILPDTPLVGAQQVAESLRRDIGKLEAVSGELRIGISASLGVTVAMPGETDVTTFIERADRALYEAKRQGRDRFCVAAPPSTTSGQEAEIVRLPSR